MSLYSGSRLARFLGKAFFASELFLELSPKGARVLRSASKLLILGPGEVLFEAGQAPSAVFIFEAGSARQYIRPGFNIKSAVRNIYPGEILGLPEALGRFHYEAGIEALGRCEIKRINIEDFTKLLEAEEKLIFRLLQVLGRSLQESYNGFSSHAFPDFPF